MKFAGKKIGIYGFGKTGISSFEHLKAANTLVCWDDSEAQCKAFADLHGGQYLVPIANWRDLDYVLVSPGVPLYYPKPHPLLAIARSIISDVEVLHLENPSAEFVGITGTNGKSTTTALLGHILKESNFAAGGNIGLPCLSMPESKGYILELSSFQLDLLNFFKPKAAAILNITPDHLDRYPSMEAYVASKKRMAKDMDQEDFLVLNIDDPNLVADDFAHTNVVTISVEGAADIYYDGRICDRGLVYELNPPKSLLGRHNLYNMLAAYAIASRLGLDPRYIISKIETFPGIAHRLEFICSSGHISFYNDSKATNADAAAKALQTLDQIFWLAGGIPKEGGIASIRNLFSKVKKAYFFGEARFEFLDVATKYGLSASVHQDITSAFNQAVLDAREFNDKCNILLSPACASFDQFRNFEERGSFFTKLVRQAS